MAGEFDSEPTGSAFQTPIIACIQNDNLLSSSVTFQGQILCQNVNVKREPVRTWILWRSFGSEVNSRQSDQRQRSVLPHCVRNMSIQLIRTKTTLTLQAAVRLGESLPIINSTQSVSQSSRNMYCDGKSTCCYVFLYDLRFCLLFRVCSCHPALLRGRLKCKPLLLVM